jgi:hypothetical protein
VEAVPAVTARALDRDRRQSSSCFSAVILYLAGNLRKVLGDRGLTAMKRLMGCCG